MFRDAQPSFGEGSDSSESCHIVEGYKRGERAFMLHQLLSEFVACFETRDGVSRFRQVHNELRIEFQATCFGTVAHAPPPGRAVCQRLRAADKCDLAVSERMQMLQRHVSANFVIDDD